MLSCRRSLNRLPALLCLGALCRGNCAAQEPASEPPLPGLEDVPAVVAKVEGRAITRRELVRELAGSSGRQAAERLVRRMLVEQAAARAGVGVTAEELDAQTRLDEIALANEVRLAPWEVGTKNFEALIRAHFRMNLNEYKTQVVRHKLLTRRLIGRDIRPTEAQLQRFFADQEDLFQPQTRYRAAHILITPLSPRDLNLGGRLMSEAAYKEKLAEERKRKDKWLREHGVSLKDAPDVDTGPEWEQSRQRALRCLDELRNGRVSWEQAVARYTQDPQDLPGLDAQHRPLPPARQRMKFPMLPGEVGWYDRQGPMVRQFYEGTRDLRPGQISDPIRTPFGFHIVKMLEVVQPEKKPYDGLRPQVEKTYCDWLIRARSENWLAELVRESDLQPTAALLWPPLPGAQPEGEADADPVVCRVNGAPLRRSAVWQELYRTEGPDALERLINREATVGPLQRLGPEHLEWLSRPASMRRGVPPPVEPIAVSAEEVDVELNADRLRLDSEKEEALKRDPNARTRSFDQYLYEEYGQTLDERRRSILAGLVLARAVTRKIQVDEGTLQMEFALAQENYREPAAFDVSHILIALPPGADPETVHNALVLARQMRQQLMDRQKTWEELVALSQDESTREAQGALGLLRSDTRTYPEIYAALAAANCEQGHIAEPIRSPRGCHVVRVERRFAERVPDFREVRARVERDYLAARGALYLDVWLRGLQRQAKIQRLVFQPEGGPPPDVFPLPEE
jgi:hypothetical protein